MTVAGVALLTSLTGFYLLIALRTVDARYQFISTKVAPINLYTLQIQEAIAQEATALRGYMPFVDAQFLQDLQAAQAKADATVKQLLALVTDAADQETVQAIQAVCDQYAAMAGEVTALRFSGQADEARELFARAGGPLEAELTRLTGSLSARYGQLQTAAVTAAGRQAALAQTVGYFTVPAALVLAVILGLIQARSISRLVVEVAQAARRLAAGDLTVQELRATAGDEVGDMACSFNQMVHDLRRLITGVSTGTQSVMAAAEKLLATSDQSAQVSAAAARTAARVAQDAQEQFRAATGVSRTMDEFQQAIRQIAEGTSASVAEVQQANARLAQIVSDLTGEAQHAAAVSEGSRQSAAAAESGAEVVEQAFRGMQRIRRSAGATADRMRDLERLSAEIGDIIDVITTITDQTHLLALNAAIEAARAGESGRGFAVVAGEVRRLADHSAQSAQQIADLIQGVQNYTAEAAGSMHEGVSEVENGSQLAAAAGQKLVEILTGVQQATGDVDSIARALGQVCQNARQAVTAFDTMKTVAEQNTAATEQMSAGAAEVNESVARIAELAGANATAAAGFSASVGELTQVSGEVASSARVLAQVAGDLQGQVARFAL